MTRIKILLEQDDRWSVVDGDLEGTFLKTSPRTFKYESEREALEAIPYDYAEASVELMPMIMGDTFRKVFTRRGGL